MASGKVKVSLDMFMVRYGFDLLGPETLKSALSQLKNKMMNSAGILHPGSDGIIFSLTINHARYLWFLNTGAPL